MAVQAAVLNPHFTPFCFPASLGDYELDKGHEDGGALGAAAGSAGESKEATRDLLNFIDSASSNIRVALDKPGKSKRKVNHRKYLQKQIKRCTGIISSGGSSGGVETPRGHPLCRPHPKREPAQASLQSRSLAALFDHSAASSSEIRAEKGKKVPLRKRNLPPSFFTEPAQCASAPAQSIALRELERCGAEVADFFELLGTDYSGVLSEQEVFHGASVRILPDLAPEHPLCEQHPMLGSLVYPEGWGPYGVSRKSPTGLGLVMPGYPTSPDSGLSSPVEDSSTPHLTQFAPFYPDCSLPPMAYDFSSGFTRAGYQNL